MLPPTKYNARLIGHEFGLHSKGNPCFTLTFELLHMANGGAWQDVPLSPTNERPHATVTLWLSDAAWDHSMRKLQKIGFNGDFDTSAFDPKFVTDGGVILELKHEQYEGKLKEVWEFEFDGRIKEAPSDLKAKLAARWRQSNATPPATTGKPAPPPAPPTAAPAAPVAPAPTAAPAPAAATATHAAAAPLAPPEAPATAAPAETVFDPSSATTKQEAWDAWCFASSGSPSIEEWTAAVVKIGKPEAEFTADDWKRVAQASIPI